MTTITELQALHSRELQKRATLLGVLNSRNIPKEELLEKCALILQNQAITKQVKKIEVKAKKTEILNKKLIPVAKIAMTIIEQKIETIPMETISINSVSSIIKNESKFKTVQKVKAIKAEVERYSMERGEFLQFYPEKRAFPITTKLLSVYRQIMDDGSNKTWTEDAEGTVISSIGKNWWKTYREAIVIKDSNPLYADHKIVVYWTKNN